MVDQTYQPSFIEAKVQSYIAKFLQAKEKLLGLQQSMDATIRGQATSLMSNQVALEAELPGKLSTVSNVKSGNYTYQDVLDLGNFATRLSNHVTSVDKLQATALGIPQKEIPFFERDFFGVPAKNLALYAGIGALVILGWWTLGRD